MLYSPRYGLKIEPEAKSNKKVRSFDFFSFDNGRWMDLADLVCDDPFFSLQSKPTSSFKPVSASGKSGFSGPVIPMSVKGRIYVNNLTSTETAVKPDGSQSPYRYLSQSRLIVFR
jgi:hypothetical protein